MFSAPELCMFVNEQAWFASPVCLSSNRLESLSCAVIDFSPHSIKFSISCGLHVLWSKYPIDAPADVSPPQLTPSTMHTPRDHLRGHIRWQRHERASFEQPLQTMPSTVELKLCTYGGWTDRSCCNLTMHDIWRAFRCWRSDTIPIHHVLPWPHQRQF